MSKKDQKMLVKRLLVRAVSIKGLNGKVILNDMFTKENNAVVVLRRRDGALLSVGQ